MASNVKIPRLTVNFFKVVVGVGFSLLWASVMYMVWPQPTYFTFLWFYLALGSIVLKWIIFEIVDRIHKRLQLRGVKRELDASRTRVQQASAGEYRASCPLVPSGSTTNGALKEELNKLQCDVSSMAGGVERAMARAVDSLEKKDLKLARDVIEADRELDLKQSAIRDYCMQVMARGCPQANDLHVIVAVLGMIAELERMGDYAEAIAKLTLMRGAEPQLATPAGINLMARTGMEMLRGSLESFLEKDVRKAARITERDEEVDTLHDDVFRGLILLMIEDPKMVTQATWLLWVAHHLERFGDRVTNICEWAVFSTMGESVSPMSAASGPAKPAT